MLLDIAALFGISTIHDENAQGGARAARCVSTNILEEWLECLSIANVIVVTNPARLYPCVPSFLDCVLAEESEKRWFTISPYCSKSRRFQLSPVKRVKTLGLPQHKPISKLEVGKPIFIKVTA